jgi:dipeptidyl aminopeptidase/acylaminoacyl peptidase
MKSATRLLPILGAVVSLTAAQLYEKPPQAVLDVLNAPPTPTLSVSPTRAYAISGQPVRYPPIAELSQPMLRIAGMRINPQSNGLHNTVFSSKLVIWKLPAGTEIPVAVPPGAKLSGAAWSPDGSRFAFTNTTNSGIELWVGETATGRARKIPGVKINAVMASRGFGGGRGGADGRNDVEWLPDGKTLLVETVKPNRGAPPPEPVVPIGPHVQESLGGAAPVVTHEDMLQNPHDERLFEYYATAQLATVDPASGKVAPIGSAAIFEGVRISPDGKYLLVTAIHRPFSYLHPAQSFPKEIEVWDRAGKVVHHVASLPLEDHVPINGVMVGPRGVEWRPSAPATLIWVEALDGGNPKTKAEYRDRIVALAAPFSGAPKEIFKTEQRWQGILMGATGGLALVSDFERARRWVRTFKIDLDEPEKPARLVWSRNNQDRYKDPGRPVERPLPNGQMAILQEGENIYLIGTGASPEGDPPRESQRAAQLFHPYGGGRTDGSY